MRRVYKEMQRWFNVRKFINTNILMHWLFWKGLWKISTFISNKNIEENKNWWILTLCTIFWYHRSQIWKCQIPLIWHTTTQESDHNRPCAEPWNHREGKGLSLPCLIPTKAPDTLGEAIFEVYHPTKLSQLTTQDQKWTN